MNFLTVKKVARLLRRGEPGRHFDGLGLYLVVKSRRNANWARRYELSHKAHEIGLGSAFVFSLSEARERNRKVSQALADGIDPLTQKRAARAAQAAAAAKTLTVVEAARAYVEAHQGQWRSAEHGHQWISSLARFVYPTIGALDIAAVDVPAVLRVLEQRVPAALGYPAGQLWTARAVTADRVRNRIELILSWATGRGYRTGDNPAAWSRLRHILPAVSKAGRVEHHSAVPCADVPQLMAELQSREGVAAKALIFTILTAARAGEVLGAQWSEIDLENATWVIAAERMKGGREHKVPLAPAAVELLRSLPTEAGNASVFIGPRNAELSHAALTAVLRRLGRSETTHGMRSSFSDWAHERTAHSNHVIELSLAHAIGNAVERSYRRGEMFDKRRKLADAWAAYCTSPPKAAVADNVTALRGARP